MNLLILTLAVPLIAAALGGFVGSRRFKEIVMVGGLALTFILCLLTAFEFLGGTVPSAFEEALRVDGLSALVLVLCGFVGVLSGVYGVGYLRRNEARKLVTPRMRSEFFGLIPAYVFAMLLVSVSNNLGVLWIAVELTTLASVFLITFHDKDTSLEAGWKFLVLGSLGLAFALLGTVLLYASGRGFLGEGMARLNWTRFIEAAPSLHPFTLRLGVMFALIGYGTKAGLAPMHTWKPDAYREAPSPAGVLMAVGMLNGALYCVLRIHLISKAALGPAFSGDLLLGLGLLSVLIATPFILVQWNLKRLLAYSSIEHVGIMAVGFGLGTEAAVFGALLHMTYHSLAKPVTFFSAGTLAQLHSSSNFDRIGNGTFTRAPVASGLLVLGSLIVMGSPPFGIFFSEMTILRAGFSGPHVAVTAVFLAALVVLFCGFAYQIGRLVLGPPRDPSDRRVPAPERLDISTSTAIVAAMVAVVSAFYLPAWLLALIHAASAVVGGGV
ncbi:MAG TPA: proton-conducting transporter membrane subunit [Vicinamibacteria bacterium]|nr:proton-conducting transporter membrane subunit [Vicinamibacteria bacterium]HRB14019.1 proton-conducting transporter membrane subunit [Vicinamibacteria bacterium]